MAVSDVDPTHIQQIPLSTDPPHISQTALVIFCGCVAVAVPDFGLAMGFVGSFTLAFLTCIFPSIFYVRLGRDGSARWDRDGCDWVGSGVITQMAVTVSMPLI